MELGDGNFFLLWNDFHKNASSTFKEMREDQDFTNVTLAFENNHEIKAHKIILASSSSFFSDMLRKIKHSNPWIYLKGVREKDLISILDLIYHGEVNIPEEDLEDFMKVGGELKVKGLEIEEQFDTSELLDMSKNQRKIKQNKANEIKKETDSKETDSKETDSKETDSKEDDSKDDAHRNYTKPELYLETTLIEQGIKPSTNGLSHSQEVKYMQQEEIFKQRDIIIKQKTSKINGTVACTDCQFKTKFHTNMKNHIESRHMTDIKDVPIPCVHCDVTTVSRSALREHLKKYHYQLYQEGILASKASNNK